MKNIATSELLEQLKADTRQIILETHQLLQKDPALLMQQPAPGKWSIAQVLEHLNCYGRFYIPAITKAIAEHTIPGHKNNPDSIFTPGWLGNWFTNAMKPTAARKIKNKMKAMKDYSPPPSVDSKSVIDEFLSQQQELLLILDRAMSTDIGRIRVPVSLTKFLKLKLGDTLRFNIAHNQRHLLQCENILKELYPIRTEDNSLLNVAGSSPR
jgi:DinB family protein